MVGKTQGYWSTRTLEKDITLKTSILLEKKSCKYKKIIPVLSRNKDIYLSLRKMN